MIVVTAWLAAMAFAILGPWLIDDLSMIVFEIGLDSGQGATALDWLALVLYCILVTPFVFVAEFSTPPRILFALNGACWACALWAAWMVWHRIRRKKAGRPKS